MSDPEFTSAGVGERNEENDDVLDADADDVGVDCLERKIVAVGEALSVLCDDSEETGDKVVETRGERELEGESVAEKDAAGDTLRAAEDEEVCTRVASALVDALPLAVRVAEGVATYVAVAVDVFLLE